MYTIRSITENRELASAVTLDVIIVKARQLIDKYSESDLIVTSNNDHRFDEPMPLRQVQIIN